MTGPQAFIFVYNKAIKDRVDKNDLFEFKKICRPTGQHFIIGFLTPTKD